TKMGVWLMRAPEVYVSGWATWRDVDATEQVVDTLRELMFEGIVRNYPLIGFGIPTEEGRDPRTEGWTCRFALYGRESLVEANYEVVRDALESAPGVNVTRRTYRGDAERSAATLHDDKVQGGVPGLELLELVHKLHGPDAGHLDLSTIHPLSGAEVVESIRMRRALNERYNIPYAGGIILLPRSVLNIST